MRTIANLFGNSPFGPLQSHMGRVAECVDKTEELFRAFLGGEKGKIEGLADEISRLEHLADEAKHDIQDGLPNSLFLPVAKGRLLEILAIQDNIADKCENVGVLFTLKELHVPESLRPSFTAFVEKNLDTFRAVHEIMHEIDDLLATSFGGSRAEAVKARVHDVAFKEHEADVLQRDLLRTLFAAEDEFTKAEFHLWNSVIKQIAELSNLSERLANRVRATLELD